MKNSIYRFQLLALFLISLSFFSFNSCLAFQGDITGNGYVDLADLAVIAEQWLISGCDVNDCKGADINGSGLVNLKDFSLLAENWNVLDPSLIGWWKFDELAADQAIDSTGNGNSGIFQGNPIRTTWELDGAIGLDGDGDYISISNESNFDIKNALTVAAWVKADKLKNDMMIIGKGLAFWLSRDYDGDYLIFNCEGTGRSLSGSMSVFDFKWHHVAAVYDGTAKYIYVDGILDNSKASSGDIIPNDEPVLIGNTSRFANAEWSGEIDDVRIYNLALSQQELQDIIRPYHLEALDMVPYDGADYEPNDTTLSWTPGLMAGSYDLYFGTDANEVENADHTCDVYIGNFPADCNTYDPGILDDGVVYYWRLEGIE